MPEKSLGPVVLDIENTELLSEDKEIICHPQVGGLILFSRNYECPQQLEELINSIRAVVPEILIAVDQEGGRVQRLREGFTRLPAMRKLGRFYAEDPLKAIELTQNIAWLMASELLCYGIDISFAPVLDLDAGLSQVIGDRAFSSEPDKVIALVSAWIEGMHQAGMRTTGKHFPGHGGVCADSHTELPVDERSMENIENSDLVPFVHLCAELDAIMPAHIIFPAIDENPVGFSSRWLGEILREKLNFQGLIFSDDLSMEGATFAGKYTDRAMCALTAGCDAVLVCNHRKGAEEVVEYLERASPIAQASSLACMSAKPTMKIEQLKNKARWYNTVDDMERYLN